MGPALGQDLVPAGTGAGYPTCVLPLLPQPRVPTPTARNASGLVDVVGVAQMVNATAAMQLGQPMADAVSGTPRNVPQVIRTAICGILVEAALNRRIVCGAQQPVNVWPPRPRSVEVMR